MNKIDKIPQLRKLASKKGTPLKGVVFGEGTAINGILFIYSCDNTEIRQEYNDVDWGIEEELKRLRKL